MNRRGIFPSKEAELSLYFTSSIKHVKSNAERLKVAREDSDLLQSELDEWIIIYPKSQDDETSTKLIVAEKNDVMERIKTSLKRVYGDIPQSVLTANDRAILNLQKPTTTRTPAPAPISFPVGQVHNTNRLEHSISFTDEDGKRGRPEKVRGCQIYCKEGAPVTDEKELRMLTSDAASPYVHKFSIADVGKTFHYWLRWENARGETGPWGPFISGTVTG